MRRTSTVRWFAGASLIAAAVFPVILGVTLARTPGFTAADFLSGLGAQGAPAAGAYRLALGAAALAAALLGISLQLAHPRVAALGFLLAAAALLGTSSALPCDQGCPIPVVDSGGGVVNAAHFFVTAAAFLLLAVAMLHLVRRCPDRVLRRLSLVAMVVEGASMAMLGVLLLFATHSLLSASVERVVLAGAFGWLVLSAARLITARAHRRTPMSIRSSLRSMSTRLVELNRSGGIVSLRLSGTAFLVSPLSMLLVGAPVGEQGQLVAGVAAVLLFAFGLTGLRQLATGLGLPLLLAAVAIIGMTAEVAGTVWQISGVAITVPLVAVIAVILYASRWRAGDLSLIGFALGLGFVVAYVADNVVHEDNGSQTDQAVPVLLAPSIALAVWVLARTDSLGRPARTCTVLGAVLGVGALVLALATRDQTFVVLAVPAGLLFGIGLVATGIDLIRLATAVRAPPAGPPTMRGGGSR